MTWLFHEHIWLVISYIVIAIISFIFFTGWAIEEARRLNAVLLQPLFTVPVLKLILYSIFWPITLLRFIINLWI